MLKIIYKILFLSLFFFFSLNTFTHAQMSDWTLIIDKDGNRYYIDKNGKIWTSGIPEFDYKPVSDTGLEYYLNQGITLIKSHKKTEGLILLKSIIALPVNNNNIYEAQIKASNEINYLIKTEGTRFKELNENASLLLIKDKGFVILFNDNMNYSIRVPSSLKIISKRKRIYTDYNFSGLLLGFSFHKEIINKNGFSGYDVLLTINTEKLPYKIKNSRTIEDHWRKRLGADTFERDVIKQTDKQIIYSYKDKYPPHYSGFEGFYSKESYGYYIKAITSKELFQKYRKQIIEVINNFKI